MRRATTGHPARALRGLIVLLVLWGTYRAPMVAAAFDAAIASRDRGEPRASGMTATARIATLVAMVEPSRAPAGAPSMPAHRSRSGGDLPFRLGAMNPGFRRDDAPAVTLAQEAQPARATPSSAEPPIAGAVVPAPGELAARAYASLAAGDRRAAAQLFDAAIAAGADPRTAAWARARARLARRWSGSAYSIVRARGDVDLAVTPVLGGGQSGAGIAFTPDPLAGRPLALIARASVAHDDTGRSALAAAGIQWRPWPNVTLAAERIIGLGSATRGDWTLRAAAGAAAAGTVETSVYGEAGVVGPVPYAAAQARVGAGLTRHGIRIVPGIGAWGSVQRSGEHIVDRLDLGPGITARTGPLALALDYRFRIAGNAAPGSGAVLTLTAGF